PKGRCPENTAGATTDNAIEVDLADPAWPCIVIHEYVHYSVNQSGAQLDCHVEELLAFSAEYSCARRLGFVEFYRDQLNWVKAILAGRQYGGCETPNPFAPPPSPPRIECVPLLGGDEVICFDVPILAPGDPNEKTGPAGFGPAAFIRPDYVLPYRIDFE